MSEKQVIVILEDGFGRVQTSIATSLSAPQLMDKIMGIDEQQAIINDLENERDYWKNKTMNLLFQFRELMPRKERLVNYHYKIGESDE